jgi:DNA-binding SARP family transcriptional activator/tetratricopeptide (TPR) repeat protein
MLQLTLLGGFQLRTDGHLADIPYQRARALLAYLVLEPGAHRREQLAAMCWPDQEATQARDSLRRMVHVLRQALGAAADGLHATRDTLSWVGAIDCDALALLAERQLCAHSCNPVTRSRCIANGEERARAYVGPLLADLDLADCPEFSLWQESRRADLQRRAVALYERLLHCCEAVGLEQSALLHAQKLVSLDPWSEGPVARLIALLVGQGRIAAARAEFTAFSARLQNELGRQPGEQLQQYIDGLPDNGSAAPATSDQRPLVVVHARHLPAADAEPETSLALLSAWADDSRNTLLAAGAYVQPLAAAGLSAYFGHPQADEHAARRAVAAALELAGPNMAIGVHGGWGLAGPTAGEVADAGGLLAATAIALAHRCPAGEVRVSKALRQRVDGWFRWQQADRQGDNDTSRPLLATAARDRLDAQPWRSAPLLGRLHEQRWLQQRWRKAKAGRTQTVLLVGEAGLGKSRLVGDWLQQQEIRCLPLLCRPEWSFSPFRPLQEASERLGIALPPELADGPPPLPDAQARQAQVAAWAAAFLAWGGAEATVLWVDDAHWLDPSTLEVLQAMAAGNGPHLFILAARPEHGLAWDALDTLELAPLPAHTMRAVANALAPGLSTERRSEAIARAEGVPLFLEALLNAGPDASLPDTLEELLASRLDQLGTARTTIEYAAIVGAHFSPALLLAMGCAEAKLTATLLRLEDAGFTQPDAEQPGSYRFRHGLLRDAVLAGMRRSTRQGLHRRAAEALLVSEAHTAQREPERLAWHYREAGDLEPAVDWLTRAVGRDAQRYAYSEAMHHGEQALTLLTELPPGPAHDGRELALRLHLGLPLAAVHGYGSAPVQATYARAQQLAGPLPDAPQFFPLLWGLWLVSSSVSGYAASRQLAERLIHLASLRPAQQDPFCAAHAYYALGNNLFCLGEFAAAVIALEQAIALAPAEPLPSPYGEDAAVTGGAFLSLAHWCLGNEQAAEAAIRQALQRARAFKQPHTLAFALIFACLLNVLRGEREKVIAYAGESMALAQQHGLALWQAASLLFLSWGKMSGGDPSAWPVLQHCVALARTVMAGVEGFFLAISADACERSGHLAEARQMALRGLEVAGERQDHFFEADFLRLLALSAATPAESARHRKKAAALAERQGARAFLRRQAAGETEAVAE